MNDQATELLALFQRATQPTLAALYRARERAPAELADVFKAVQANLFEPRFDHTALRRDVAAGLASPARKRKKGKGCASPLAEADRLLALFRREIGLAPHLCVLEGRMEVAARLLIDSDRTVADVGDLVGYTDPAAFRRAFKRWTGGLAPGPFRARMRTIAARLGPPPEGVLSWWFWNRLRRGELSDQEIRRLLAYLEALYEAPPERTPMDSGTAGHPGPRRLLAAELTRRLPELPWDRQRHLVRASLRFGSPELFERLRLDSRAAGRRDRGRSVELMELAIVSLETRGEHRGADDPARLRLAWTRMAWNHRMARDPARADQALGFAALERDRVPAEDQHPLWVAECLTLEADVRWSQGRDDMAVTLLDQALALVDGEAHDDELRVHVLLLRAGVRLFAPRPTRADVDRALDDLRRARRLLGHAHPTPEHAELYDLWLRLHAMLGDTREIRRCLGRARELGGPALRARCKWYEGVALRNVDPARAERCLRNARAALIDLDQSVPAAPASLELVALYLSRGQLNAAEANAGHLVDTLTDAASTPERLAALKALRQALRAKNLTPEVLKLVRHAVAGLERDAKAAAGPAFEI